MRDGEIIEVYDAVKQEAERIGLTVDVKGGAIFVRRQGVSLKAFERVADVGAFLRGYEMGRASQ